MENLARYIIRAFFSQERMTYLDQEATVIYAAKDGKNAKVFRSCTELPFNEVAQPQE